MQPQWTGRRKPIGRLVAILGVTTWRHTTSESETGKRRQPEGRIQHKENKNSERRPEIYSDRRRSEREQSPKGFY